MYKCIEANNAQTDGYEVDEQIVTYTGITLSAHS